MTSQYGRLGVHVSASDLAVIREARKLLSDHGKSAEMRRSRFAWYRAILECHHDHQKMVRAFRL